MNNKNKSDNHNNQTKKKSERERENNPLHDILWSRKIGTTAQSHSTSTTSLRAGEREWLSTMNWKDDKRENDVVVR